MEYQVNDLVELNNGIIAFVVEDDEDDEDDEEQGGTGLPLQLVYATRLGQDTTWVSRKGKADEDDGDDGYGIKRLIWRDTALNQRAAQQKRKQAAKLLAEAEALEKSESTPTPE